MNMFTEEEGIKPLTQEQSDLIYAFKLCCTIRGYTRMKSTPQLFAIMIRHNEINFQFDFLLEKDTIQIKGGEVNGIFNEKVDPTPEGVTKFLDDVQKMHDKKIASKDRAEQRKADKLTAEQQALATDYDLSLAAVQALYIATERGSNGSPHATVKRVLEWRKKFDTRA